MYPKNVNKYLPNNSCWVWKPNLRRAGFHTCRRVFRSDSKLLIWMILALVILAGCASNAEKDDQGSGQTGLANPASVYCQQLGFKEETRETEAGQYGVCIFEDGSECDTWDFLAGRCGQEHSYCSQQGFELKSVNESNIATCIFEDGSTCDEFSYFQGDCKPGDNLP